MKRAPILAALLITTQAGAWTQDTCVYRESTLGSVQQYLRCSFTHSVQDAKDYRSLYYECLNTTVPGSYTDPFSPGYQWRTHGSVPLVQSLHSVTHSWAWNIRVPCENATWEVTSYGKRQFREPYQTFVYNKKGQPFNISGSGCLGWNPQ